MREGLLKNKKRERYVWGRHLQVTIGEFDTGPFNFKDEGPRGKNLIKVIVEIDRTCPACPLQYEGKVTIVKIMPGQEDDTSEQYDIYYRSRWQNWSVEIGYNLCKENEKILHTEEGDETIESDDDMIIAEDRMFEACMNFAEDRRVGNVPR